MPRCFPRSLLTVFGIRFRRSLQSRLALGTNVKGKPSSLMCISGLKGITDGSRSFHITLRAERCALQSGNSLNGGVRHAELENIRSHEVRVLPDPARTSAQDDTGWRERRVRHDRLDSRLGRRVTPCDHSRRLHGLNQHSFFQVLLQSLEYFSTPPSLPLSVPVLTRSGRGGELRKNIQAIIKNAF